MDVSPCRYMAETSNPQLQRFKLLHQKRLLLAQLVQVHPDGHQMLTYVATLQEPLPGADAFVKNGRAVAEYPSRLKYKATSTPVPIHPPEVPPPPPPSSLLPARLVFLFAGVRPLAKIPFRHSDHCLLSTLNAQHSQTHHCKPLSRLTQAPAAALTCSTTGFRHESHPDGLAVHHNPSSPIFHPGSTLHS